ncbi:MAG: RsmB/NOP family class I SAM-dependent RNA methyltransferase [Bacteriovoracaceae bacterium]
MGKKLKGEAAFDAFYAEIYQDRWAKLRASLSEDIQKIPRVHREVIENPYFRDSYFSNSEPQKEVYYMDLASIIAAKCLGVKPGETVLDMCAAPGGKSLILVEDLFPNGLSDSEGEIWLNEYSTPRKERLKRTIVQYEGEFHPKLYVKNFDGAQIGIHNPDYFDRILLDAPCSSEEHLIKKPEYLSEWKESRTKHLSKKQYGLLCSALIACKKGGRILYSTCSLSPFENDGVIEKLSKKKGDEFKLISPPEEVIKQTEPTEWGYQILPDKFHMGPFYFSLLEKI